MMWKLLKVAAALGLSAFGMVGTSSEAEARMCMRRVCAARAPFVCKGPIGSCGFAQGRCMRYRTERFFVPGPSCAGRPDPVR